MSEFGRARITPAAHRHTHNTYSRSASKAEHVMTYINTSYSDLVEALKKKQVLREASPVQTPMRRVPLSPAG